MILAPVSGWQSPQSPIKFDQRNGVTHEPLAYVLEQILPWPPEGPAFLFCGLFEEKHGLGHPNSAIDDLLPWAYASPEQLKDVA